VPARYADGYRSGLTSARSLVDQRISALIAAGDDRTPMTPTSDFRGDWSLFAYEQRTEPAAWALECVPAYNARRPSAAWTPAQRVLDVLVPVGGRSRAATRLADLLVGRLPVLGQDHAVLVAQLADARRRYDLMSGRLRVLWDDLGLTRDALYWRAELASQLLVAAATISAGIGGVADDFLAGFNSGSNRVVRYLTARAAEVGVPHELL
jgi:hypothetical protein